MDLRGVGPSRVNSEQVRATIREVVDTDVGEPFGAYLFAPDDPGAAVGRLLEQEVFLESFGNTSEQLAKEYEAYESSSVFFCVVDHRRATLAGMMRMILPTAHGPGLKSLVDLEPVWGRPAAALFAEAGLAMEPGRMWDIATLAVAPEYRSAASAGLVSLGIYQAFVRTADRVGIESLVTILDYVAYRTLRVRVRVPFIALAEGRPYLGSRSSIPALVPLGEWRERLGRVQPELLRIIFEGEGIAPALRPVDLDISTACVLRTMAP